MAETVEISGYMSNVGMGTTKTIENCAGSVKTLSSRGYCSLPDIH